MKLRNAGRIAVAGLAIAAALSVSACGSDDPKPAKKVATTSASAAQQIPEPTVPMLKGMLDKALDPKVPAAEKADLIQGFEKDPNQVQKLADQFTKNKGVVNITKVNYSGGTNAQATGDGNVAGTKLDTLEVPFVFENSKWKVEKNYACAMMKNLSIPNTVCTA